MGCTNHFNQLVEENRHHLVESKERLDHIRDHIEKKLSPLEAFSLFNEDEYGIFKEDYWTSAGTLHTVAYVPETLQVIVGIGRKAKPL
ncbi:carcinine hydrolase/isopenicillin-N N-acyltransferase family protein, partial [Priestia sp. 40]|uniref:carcinine hydrolase/isopenicillin-N N-acyltransferase family protein n=1 Tax=Priestia sp. 40 TaxID=3394459 RepID=UPI003BF7EC0C